MRHVPWRRLLIVLLTVVILLIASWFLYKKFLKNDEDTSTSRPGTAEELFRSGLDADGQARAKLSDATALARTGKYDEALKLVNEARQGVNSLLLAQTYSAEAGIYLQQNKLSEAAAALEKGLAIAEIANNPTAKQTWEQELAAVKRGENPYLAGEH
jgi:tetratricopeptide (TPR) repeat protein